MGMINKKVASILLIAGVFSIVMGAVFISQAISKRSLILQTMLVEKVSYEAADGAIQGIVDTPEEALVMAGILADHRRENYGLYVELARDDPNRAQILKAMTMENSLYIAQLGYGLTEVVQANGIFMLVIGLALGTTGAYGIRAR
ncbi:MAG: hypothetical protein KKF26_01445 [Chloroflexi bacterium]|nr:hypothetical protein [Chloroflexota bacterium]